MIITEMNNSDTHISSLSTHHISTLQSWSPDGHNSTSKRNILEYSVNNSSLNMPSTIKAIYWEGTVSSYLRYSSAKTIRIMKVQIMKMISFSMNLKLIAENRIQSFPCSLSCSYFMGYKYYTSIIKVLIILFIFQSIILFFQFGYMNVSY